MDLKTYRREVLGELPADPPASKLKNKPVVIDGIRFDSQLEGAYYLLLEFEKTTGNVSHYFMQVPIILTGSSKYRLDFLVFLTNGDTKYIDVKGHESDVFKLKKRQVKDLYPFEIQCVLKKEIPKHYLATVKDIQAYG